MGVEIGRAVGWEGPGTVGYDEVGGRRKRQTSRVKMWDVLTSSISFRLPAGNSY
jgi:hypothetical protein